MGKRRNKISTVLDLSDDIIFKILLYLPPIGIVMCKNTCKIWYRLISSTNFAKFHFLHAKPCILLQNEHRVISRMLYLVERPFIYTAYCCCGGVDIGYQLNLELDIKLKIPMLMTSSRTKCTFNLKYTIVNSCNGLLCLAEIGKYNPTVICNPVTNEYIELPAPASYTPKHEMYAGFGFCQVTNQYKVLRVDRERVAEIHTVGTVSWKNVGFAPFFQSWDWSPIHLNGVLHWITDSYKSSSKNGRVVFSFDLTSECFESLPQPPVSQGDGCALSLGEIAGCLCLHADSSYVGGLIDFWIMKKKNSGAQQSKSWSKLLSLGGPQPPASLQEMYISHFFSTSCSECKMHFIFYTQKNKITYYDHKRKEWKKLRLVGQKFQPRPIIHTPSFISLKDVVPRATTKPIQGELVLRGESVPLYLIDGP